MTEWVPGTAAALLPVVLFLAALIWLDSYKLVRPRAVLLTIAGGLAAALASWAVNDRLIFGAVFEVDTYARYVAPPIEETAKALIVMALIRASRIGFLVDAAIYGFAVGTGFALAENVLWLHALGGSYVALWLLRGCGTAMMHGGTTAIFAIVAKSMHERRGLPGGTAYLPGWVLAVVIHSAYNHFFLSPALSALVILLTLPLLLWLVFATSERSLEEWLRVGFDADSQLLEMIRRGEVADTKVGQYLHALTAHFPGAVVADMLCYLRIRVELSLRAKALLIMREHGFAVATDRADRERLAELGYLEKSIGRAGRLALAPFVRTSGKELWQITMLG